MFLVLNVFLEIFNLLPLPPLDGASVFGVLLPERHANSLHELESNGLTSILGLIVAWRVFPFITGPLLPIPLRLVYPSEMYGP